MNNSYHNALRVSLLALVLFAGHTTSRAQSADALLQRVEAKYEDVSTLRAEFTQTMSSSYGDQDQSFAGTVLLQADKYRVETGNQTLVTDGKTTWVFNKDENQVVINSNVDDETSFSLSGFLFDVRKQYDAVSARSVSLDGQKHFLLLLKPKDTESFFREVRLWLRDGDTMVTRLEVNDANETKMTFNLRNVELNPKLSASAFSFKPPSSAEVIDLRS